ncbi:MAG: MoaD family protein [Candidatus Methanomethyliaceae archaeon]|nr:MoaD family protein [Candidatus Methanomethyliaceae archaeon]MCX8169687.1 MoaD family protein [Candidatus Methanomethyliaceae archaeon]MDW7971510.1 MoaD family protein [Nitrososphaerota archaeon]
MKIPTVKVRYLAVLKGLSKEPIKEVSINGDSLLNLLEFLKSIENEELKLRLFDKSGEIRPDIIIFINGRDFNLLGGKNSKINDGDEITILPSVHGG